MFWEIAEQAIGKLEMPQVTRFSADNNIDNWSRWTRLFLRFARHKKIKKKVWQNHLRQFKIQSFKYKKTKIKPTCYSYKKRGYF